MWYRDVFSILIRDVMVLSLFKCVRLMENLVLRLLCSIWWHLLLQQGNTYQGLHNCWLSVGNNAWKRSYTGSLKCFVICLISFRFILRVLPIEVACYASVEEITRAIKPLIEKNFPVESQSPVKVYSLYIPFLTIFRFQYHGASSFVINPLFNAKDQERNV